jgi:hypothetical protein
MQKDVLLQFPEVAWCESAGPIRLVPDVPV